MAQGDPKFASEHGEEWLAHDYGKVFARQNASTTPRLCIGASTDGSGLLQALSQFLSEPLLLLYVLVVPRGSVPGRYQSDDLTRDQCDILFQRFAHFWDHDGRHSIWLHSRTDSSTLVYDRHNLIYAYGSLAPFESLLASLGYSATRTLSVSFIHQHAYHAEFDHLERELVVEFAEGRSELRVGDENP
jgi:hypothetical protein